MKTRIYFFGSTTSFTSAKREKHTSTYLAYVFCYILIPQYNEKRGLTAVTEVKLFGLNRYVTLHHQQILQIPKQLNSLL